ncbi:MAG TPA: hypothetical protein VLD15_07480 [Burkholderiales bacterium]|nr:hypothetical protein [Burkholderiales bacterium]
MAAVDPAWVTFSVSQNQIAKWRDEIAKGLVLEPKNRDYTIRIALRGAIVVPQLAVQQGSNGHLVYVVNRAGSAGVRPVVVGGALAGRGVRPAGGGFPGCRRRLGRRGREARAAADPDG